MLYFSHTCIGTFYYLNAEHRGCACVRACVRVCVRVCLRAPADLINVPLYVIRSDYVTPFPAEGVCVICFVHRCHIVSLGVWTWRVFDSPESRSDCITSLLGLL